MTSRNVTNGRSTLAARFTASIARQEDAAIELLNLTAALHPDARALAAAARRSYEATGRLAAFASLLARESRVGAGCRAK